MSPQLTEAQGKLLGYSILDKTVGPITSELTDNKSNRLLKWGALLCIFFA
jgi:hypothetical protein